MVALNPVGQQEIIANLNLRATRSVDPKVEISTQVCFTEGQADRQQQWQLKQNTCTPIFTRVNSKNHQDSCQNVRVTVTMSNAKDPYFSSLFESTAKEFSAS